MSTFRTHLLLPWFDYAAYGLAGRGDDAAHGLLTFLKFAYASDLF